jgi:hypothetical protein
MLVEASGEGLLKEFAISMCEELFIEEIEDLILMRDREK